MAAGKALYHLAQIRHLTWAPGQLSICGRGLHLKTTMCCYIISRASCTPVQFKTYLSICLFLYWERNRSSMQNYRRGS